MRSHFQPAHRAEPATRAAVTLMRTIQTGKRISIDSLGAESARGRAFDRHHTGVSYPLGGGSGAICERQHEAEGRAHPRRGLEPDSAVHALDQLAANVEPEPGTPHAAGSVRGEAERRLEQW